MSICRRMMNNGRRSASGEKYIKHKSLLDISLINEKWPVGDVSILLAWYQTHTKMHACTVPSKRPDPLWSESGWASPSPSAGSVGLSLSLSLSLLPPPISHSSPLLVLASISVSLFLFLSICSLLPSLTPSPCLSSPLLPPSPCLS